MKVVVVKKNKKYPVGSVISVDTVLTKEYKGLLTTDLGTKMVKVQKKFCIVSPL